MSLGEEKWQFETFYGGRPEGLAPGHHPRRGTRKRSLVLGNTCPGMLPPTHPCTVSLRNLQVFYEKLKSITRLCTQGESNSTLPSSRIDGGLQPYGDGASCISPNEGPSRITVLPPQKSLRDTKKVQVVPICALIHGPYFRSHYSKAKG